MTVIKYRSSFAKLKDISAHAVCSFKSLNFIYWIYIAVSCCTLSVFDFIFELETVWRNCILYWLGLCAELTETHWFTVVAIFLPRDAMRKCGTRRRPVFVCNTRVLCRNGYSIARFFPPGNHIILVSWARPVLPSSTGNPRAGASNKHGFKNAQFSASTLPVVTVEC